MIWILLTGYILALLAPVLYRYLRNFTHYFLALYPSLIFISMLSSYQHIISGSVVREVTGWIPSLSINFEINLDGLSFIFVLIIALSGIFTILYSGTYLKKEDQKGRFFAILIFFLTSMSGLVLAGNLITLFLFWELTGISSYQLIGFYHEKPENTRAANQALLITSSGALAMLASFILIGQEYNSYRIDEILANNAIQNSPDQLIIILLLAGAFTKSAQFPFHFWLPGAMAAPAPVSSYLHSATMVKAGIYLVARFNPLFKEEVLWQDTLIVTGTITMLTGAILCFNKNDLKEILAYTTVSALGLIFLMFGIGTSSSVAAGFVYLIAHVFYKGTLFLVAGNIDHSTGTRLISRLSGLGRMIPWTAASAILSCLSMAGIIPFIGYTGKELIYESLTESGFLKLSILAAVFFSSAIFTSITIKIGYGLFYGKLISPVHPVHESSFLMLAGPILLSVCGLLLGLFAQPILQPTFNFAISAITGKFYNSDLSIWHGFNINVMLSLLTLSAGIIFFIISNPINQFIINLKFPVNLNFQKFYDKGLTLMLKISYKITRFIQNGHLRSYLATIFIVNYSILAYIIISRNLAVKLDFPAFDLSEQDISQWFICICIATGIIIIMTSKSRVTSVVSMGVSGYGLALLFILFSAPDVAMTQFMVETLTVILFVLVLHELPRFEILSGKTIHIVDLLISLFAGGIMTCILLSVTKQPLNSSIKSFIGENSLNLAKGKNLVNVILVDIRGFDTLGESIVLAIAAMGIFTLLKLKIREREQRL